MASTNIFRRCTQCLCMLVVLALLSGLTPPSAQAALMEFPVIFELESGAANAVPAGFIGLDSDNADFGVPGEQLDLANWLFTNLRGNRWDPTDPFLTRPFATNDDSGFPAFVTLDVIDFESPTGEQLLMLPNMTWSVNAINPGSLASGTYTVTPIPSSLLLLASGLLCVGGLRRRFRNRV